MNKTLLKMMKEDAKACNKAMKTRYGQKLRISDREARLGKPGSDLKTVFCRECGAAFRAHKKSSNIDRVCEACALKNRRAYNRRHYAKFKAEQKAQGSKSE